MNKNIKLWVADVDNTLRTENSPVPGSLNIKAFEQMHKEGVILGIASGRPLWQGVTDHHNEWNLSFQFDFLIGMNGGELWTKDTNETKTYHLLTTEQLKDIVLAFQSFAGTNPFVYRDGYMLIHEKDEFMIASSKRHHSPLQVATSDEELYAVPTGKILYRCESEEIAKKLEEYGKERYQNEIAVFRTAPYLVELQSPLCTKGTGLQTYCETHGIQRENILAFGDAENDIEMLKYAGTSVCVASGMDTVKAITTEISEYPASDNAIGHYLYDHKYLV